MKTFIEKLDDALRAELSRFGFEHIRPRRWIRSTKAPIREIFEFTGQRQEKQEDRRICWPQNPSA